MVDYEVYNTRRQQLIDEFSEDPYYLLEFLHLKIDDLVDLVEWEDSAELASEMGWTDESLVVESNN